MKKTAWFAAHLQQRLALLLISLLCLTSSLQAATLVLKIEDPPNTGFYDKTPVTPLPDNPGRTLGEQRLHLFRHAADRWGERLHSSVPIVVQAQWFHQDCNDKGFIRWGGGSVRGYYRDFRKAPKRGIYYPAALADALAGEDLNPGKPDLQVGFNSAFDSIPECRAGLGETYFYYGLDHKHGPKKDLFNIVMHEFAHGLGFITLTNSSRGIPDDDKRLGIFDSFLYDETQAKFWTQMSNPEIIRSGRNQGNLVWRGPHVDAAAAKLIRQGLHPRGRMRVHASGGKIFHWGEAEPSLLMEEGDTSNLTARDGVDLTLCAFMDMGWRILPPFRCPDLATPD